MTSFEEAQLDYLDAVRRARLEKTSESYRAVATPRVVAGDDQVKRVAETS